MSYLQEKVLKAWYYQRPLNAKGGKTLDKYTGIGHVGIVVQTDKGNKYLIHSGPGNGCVATDAKNMSKEWKEQEELQVKWNPTISECLQAAGVWLSHFIDNNTPGVQYWAGLLCYGSASRLKELLANPDYFKKKGEAYIFASELP